MTEWLAYFKARPFGFVRDSMLFGTLAAQTYNIHKARGRDRNWVDMFPIAIRATDQDGRLTDQAAIELFKQYNAERGYK